MQATSQIIDFASIYIRCLLLLFLASISGCKVGPEFHKPSEPVKNDWSLANHPRMLGESARIDSWWLHFEAPVLHQLICESLAQNFTLREAGERILEACARRDIATGIRLGQLNCFIKMLRT